MSLETVAVTGGSGLIGNTTIRHLNEHGYRTINLDRKSNDEADAYINVDLLDAGHVYGALEKYQPDAIIHMGTLPDPLNHPGYVTYESNVMTSYLILEAASAFNIESVCLASSVNVIGKTYQDALTEIEYFPIDEEHPVTPRDPYALGKHVLEVTSEGFARRPNAPKTISAIRYPLVASTKQLREEFAEVDRSLEAIKQEWTPSDNIIFSYLHVEDAAEIARRAIEATFDGYEVFWAAAADTTVNTSTTRLIEEFFPEVEVRSELSDSQGLIRVEKAREYLEWNPHYTWREL